MLLKYTLTEVLREWIYLIFESTSKKTCLSISFFLFAINCNSANALNRSLSILSKSNMFIFYNQYNQNVEYLSKHEVPEQWRKRQINQPIVADALGDHHPSQSEYIILFLHFIIADLREVQWCRKQSIIANLFPPDRRVLDLLRDETVELESGSLSCSLLVLVLDFEEGALVDLLHEGEGTVEDFVAVCDHFLLALLGRVLIFRDSSDLLLQELAQEIDAAVHVDGSNEGNKLEKEQSGLEREEKRTIGEDLLESLGDCASYKSVRVLDVAEDVGIEFVMVEERLVQL